MKKLLTWATILLIIIPNLSPCGATAQAGKVFVTWEGFEADKLASIWLIQRFISPGATVLVLPKGGPAADGIPFDIPGAAITRTFNRSSFESLMDHYDIQDPRLLRMGKLIHDVEINLWERKMFKKSSEMEIYLLDLITSHTDPKNLITRSNAYFDTLYQTLSHDLEKNNPSSQ